MMKIKAEWIECEVTEANNDQRKMSNFAWVSGGWITWKRKNNKREETKMLKL